MRGRALGLVRRSVCFTLTAVEMSQDGETAEVVSVKVNDAGPKTGELVHRTAMHLAASTLDAIEELAG
jgi:hypothetical protein